MSTEPLTEPSADSDAEQDAEPLRAVLADTLTAEGLLDDPAWRDAFMKVARHHHVPGFYLSEGLSSGGLPIWEPVTDNINRRRWLEAIYTDETLPTQFDGNETDWDCPQPRIGGTSTSSSTLPSLVLRMWIDADLQADHRVLEIGTGTGYSTALAWERLGEDSELTSIEVDTHRLNQAATALFGNNRYPNLACADGLYGYWPYAPYDRIVAACSVRAIPAPWIGQTSIGGKILTTLSGGLAGYARVLLTVAGDSAAEGNLLPGSVSFMPARAQATPNAGTPNHWAPLVTGEPSAPVRHEPARLTELVEETVFACFLAQLAAPDTQLAMVDGEIVLMDVATGSVAVLTPGSDGRSTVRQRGPRRLWSAIEAAWDAWDDAGRPGPETFRMRIRDGRQTIYHPSAAGLSFTLAGPPV